MDVLAGFLSSKRALLCLVLLIACTVLAIMEIFTKQDWIDYTKYVVTVWVSGETVTKVAEVIAASKKSDA